MNGKKISSEKRCSKNQKNKSGLSTQNFNKIIVNNKKKKKKKRLNY